MRYPSDEASTDRPRSKARSWCCSAHWRSWSSKAWPFKSAGQVASLVFGGHRLVPGGVGAGTGIFLRLWRHLADPALAWSPLGPGIAARTRGPVGLTARHAAGRCRARHRDHPIGPPRPGQRRGACRRAGEGQPGPRRAHAWAASPSSATPPPSTARMPPPAREPLALGVDVATGARLFAKSEDYILAVGVPRVGKGEGFVIPAVLRHKGPAVVTATRHDTYMDTAACPGQSRTGLRVRPPGPGPQGGEVAVEPGQGLRGSPEGHPACPRVRRLRRRRTGRRRRRGVLGTGGGLDHPLLPARGRPGGLGCRTAPRLVAPAGGS